jgi:tRNA (cmo5U34)-methyltransferase
MDGFSGSQWTDRAFVSGYLRIADVQVMERKAAKGLLASFYDTFLKDRGAISALDLGCGCGPYAQVLLEKDPGMRVDCLDASCDMLTAAQGMLGAYPGVRFLHTTFEELMETEAAARYDVVVSSLAIHHLPRRGKSRLNTWIFRSLRPGGWFINIDTMLPPPGLEDWYIRLWQEWAMKEAAAQGMQIDVDDIIFGHHQVPAHHALLDPLPVQLDLLEEAGFTEVDCIHKHGIFAILCGRRAGP